MYNDITVSPFLQTKEELFINRQFITDKGETVFITSHEKNEKKSIKSFS
jgi:hypothetical protein